MQASRSKVQGPERVGGHPEWFAITAAVVAASAAAGSLSDASASRKAQERTTLDTTCSSRMICKEHNGTQTNADAMRHNGTCEQTAKTPWHRALMVFKIVDEHFDKLGLLISKK